MNPPDIAAQSWVGRVEVRRIAAGAPLDPSRRSELGQFFTPAPLGDLLASMFDSPSSGRVRLLDAGAGVGSLTAAFLARAERECWRATIEAHAFEADSALLPDLEATFVDCAMSAVRFVPTVSSCDFVGWACDRLDASLLTAEVEPYDFAILNPPYRKLASNSVERRRLSGIGLEVSNLYAAFVALAVRLLKPGGQLVAITPRSFCNGPYFKAFRRELLSETALRRVHLFEARDAAFKDADVLQENVVVHAVKGAPLGMVTISTSGGVGVEDVQLRKVSYGEVVHETDPNQFIHVVPDDHNREVALRISKLSSRLGDFDVAVSTGRVVDFRVREHLRDEPDATTVPLLYPMHLSGGRVTWPIPAARKPNALVCCEATSRLLLPAGNYVLAKRFTTKEERRRVVATVLLESDLSAPSVAIENHVNVFHCGNAGMPAELTWGLATYLNSTVVDAFFRQFNGHTQVNATDLRSLRYPSREELNAIGKQARREPSLDQPTIDRLVCAVVPDLVIE